MNGLSVRCVLACDWLDRRGGGANVAGRPWIVTIPGCSYNVTMKITLVSIFLLTLLTDIHAIVYPQKNFDLQRVRTLAVYFLFKMTSSASLCRSVACSVASYEATNHVLHSFIEFRLVWDFNSWIMFVWCLFGDVLCFSCLRFEYWHEQAVSPCWLG